MLHKTVQTTEAGETISWVLKGAENSGSSEGTFHISLFIMSDDYSAKSGATPPIRTIGVEMFDPAILSWEPLIPNGFFSYDEVMKMYREETVLETVQKFVRDFFGIEMSW